MCVLLASQAWSSASTQHRRRMSALLASMCHSLLCPTVYLFQTLFLVIVLCIVCSVVVPRGAIFMASASVLNPGAAAYTALVTTLIVCCSLRWFGYV